MTTRKTSGLLVWGLCIFLAGCSVTPTNTSANLNDGDFQNGSASNQSGNAFDSKEQNATSNGTPSQLTNLITEQQMNRPIIVMVENSPKARPQTGLDKADVVYEILAEGDITRFAAVFQSQKATVIGPVRSIRPYFVQLGAALDAVIVHAGWSPDAMQTIKELDVDHFDQVYGDEAYYWRDRSRKMPHNLYTSTEKILTGVQAKKLHTNWGNRGWVYSASNEGATESGVEANAVQIPYMGGYQVSYKWDADQKAYVRSMNGKAHVDRESNQAYLAHNVLICKTKHKVVDDLLRLEVDVLGPGTGWLIQNGKALEIKWELNDGLVRAFDANGNELAMQDGKTWVQFVMSNAKIKWN